MPWVEPFFYTTDVDELWKMSGGFRFVSCGEGTRLFRGEGDHHQHKDKHIRTDNRFLLDREVVGFQSVGPCLRSLCRRVSGEIPATYGSCGRCSHPNMAEGAGTS